MGTAFIKTQKVPHAIELPERIFNRLKNCSNFVVIDHRGARFSSKRRRIIRAHHIFVKTLKLKDCCFEKYIRRFFFNAMKPSLNAKIPTDTPDDS